MKEICGSIQRPRPKAVNVRFSLDVSRALILLAGAIFCGVCVWNLGTWFFILNHVIIMYIYICLVWANRAALTADSIWMACAILLAVAVWKLTPFSADFVGRSSICGVCDTKPTEGERLVRQLWHYTPFSVEKPAKQVQRVACSGSFF